MEEFAQTERQKEILAAWKKHHQDSGAAAQELGIARANVNAAIARIRRNAAQQGYSPEHNMTRGVPDGFRVKGVSSYYDKDGKLRGQWVKSMVDWDRQKEIFNEIVAGLSDEIPRLPPRPAPAQTLSGNLLNLYPVGDHHVGMYAWDEEAGGNYDLEISERLLNGAIDHLVASAPQAHYGAVAFMGDFMHYDSMEPVTPTSKNQLDSDGRFAAMVRSAIRMVRRCIDRALDHHQKVYVIVEIGNHDLASSVFMAEAIRCLYENDPRVSVDTSPSVFHYLQFGQNLIGFHHGHTTKMKDLPMVMANDKPDAWGTSKHRAFFTGHIHHERALELAGCRVESLAVLPPSDAWAHAHGYRSGRNMKAITYHREHGEVSRITFDPSMIED